MKIIRTGGRECFTDLPLHVNWSLTKRCNYRCSYCFHYGKGKNLPPQLPFSTLEQIRNAVDNIASLNRPWYDVAFGGGEPTIHPHIFDIIMLLHEKLGERLNHIDIISNGSRNKELYKKIADVSKLINITMNISMHTDYVEISHILELIENLSADIQISFSLMFNPDKRELVHELYETLLEYRKKYRFNLSVVTLFGTIDSVDLRYTPEDSEWQKKANKQFYDLTRSVESKFPAPKKLKHYFQVIYDIEDNGQTKTVEARNRSLEISEGFLNFKGMYCIAHANVLRIEEDGRCSGMVCTEPPICNIFEKGSLMAVRDKLIHAFKCPLKLCNCPVNDHIPKFTSEEEAKKYVEFAQKRQAALFDEYIAQQEKKNSIVELEQKNQIDLSDEQEVAQLAENNSNHLPRITSNEIIGMSENSLSDYFGKADIVRKITEYEYTGGDKNSKVIYKVQDGIVTEITCSRK